MNEHGRCLAMIPYPTLDDSVAVVGVKGLVPMAKYRKKPVVIEAEQWDGTVEHIVPGLCVKMNCDAHTSVPHVHTLEGPLWASKGDWIIRGIRGEYYPCKPDIFEATYEPAFNPTLL